MKKVVRVMGCNGVIYEERMTDVQLRQFLDLIALGDCVGSAFQEWTIEVADDKEEQGLIVGSEPLGAGFPSGSKGKGATG